MDGRPIGAALAVILIAIPVAILGTRDRGDDVPRAVSAPAEQLPDDLDLTVGMANPESGEPVVATDRGVGLSRLTFCGRPSPFAGDRRTDQLSAEANGPEYADLREVVLYADGDAAQSVLTGLLEVARACAREDWGSGSVTLTEVRSWPTGDDAAIVARTYEQDGMMALGAEILHFARIGNALLAASTYAEWAPGSNLELGIAQQSDALQPVLHQLKSR